AGIVADRYDRRLVLLVTDLARGALMVVLAAAVALDASTIVVVAVSILAACFSTFFGPAIAALLPMLVDERDLGPANSAWATLDNVAFIVGPAIAGLLLAGGGLELAFLLNAVSFTIVAAILWRMPVPAGAPVVEAGDVSESAQPAPGWRALVRPLAGPFILDSTTSIVGGGLGVLTVVLAIDVLNAGEAGTGYLNAATGVGGVVAGLLGGALLARRLGVPLIIGGVAGGIGLAWLAVAGDLLVAMVAIAVGVAGLLLLDVVNTTLIQRIVPDALRGRAMGVLQTTSAVLYALGSLAMPIIADAVGIGPVLVASAIITAMGVAAALLLSEGSAAPAPLDAARARLLEHPFFAGLPVSRLEAAARQMVEVPVAAGDVIVSQGEPADRFYLVTDGSVRVTQTPDSGGRDAHLRDLGAGDVFGEIGLLRRSPRTATVTATTPGTLLALDADAFHELVSSGPGLSTRLLDLYRGAISRS
ncbi:MAG: MFS transporter, partial [Candidatus Limnocylindria bacterium]